MIRAEAERHVRSCSEDEGPETYADATEVFEALFERAPDAEDGDMGMLWSHCSRRCSRDPRHDARPARRSAPLARE